MENKTHDFTQKCSTYWSDTLIPLIKEKVLGHISSYVWNLGNEVDLTEKGKAKTRVMELDVLDFAEKFDIRKYVSDEDFFILRCNENLLLAYFVAKIRVTYIYKSDKTKTPDVSVEFYTATDKKINIDEMTIESIIGILDCLDTPTLQNREQEQNDMTIKK